MRTRPRCPCYRPRAAAGFRPRRIILAKGTVGTPARRRLAEQIGRAYPDADVLHLPNVPHNRVDLGEAGPLAALRRGKRTLVLGRHRSAVRRSREDGNTCPNYWHVSPYGFCPYGCSYCYLAGTPGVRFSPTVKVFVNLAEILARVDRVATRLAEPTAFYVGKLQDGLALDPLTVYSRMLVPFFAEHRYARMTLLTKSAAATACSEVPMRSEPRQADGWLLPKADCRSYLEPVLLSACFLGLPCRWHGRRAKRGDTLPGRLRKKYVLVHACPEQLGGMPTLRSGEILRGRTGADVLEDRLRIVAPATRADLTYFHVNGSRYTLEITRAPMVTW